MEMILLVIFMNMGNILCFIIGAKIGQKVEKGERITLPNLNPIKAVKESIENKKEERTIQEYQKLFDNIDNYDKPGYSQKEVRIDE